MNCKKIYLKKEPKIKEMSAFRKDCNKMLCRVSLDFFLGMSAGIPQGIVPCLSRYHTNHIEIKVDRGIYVRKSSSDNEQAWSRNC